MRILNRFRKKNSSEYRKELIEAGLLLRQISRANWNGSVLPLLQSRAKKKVAKIESLVGALDVYTDNNGKSDTNKTKGK